MLEAVPETLSTFGERSRKVFLAGLKLAGGIKSSLASDIHGEGAMKANRASPGLFSKNGMEIDMVAEWMEQNGYLESEDTDAAIEKIHDALHGRPVYTTEGEMEAAAMGYAEASEDDLRATSEQFAVDWRELSVDGLHDEVDDLRFTREVNDAFLDAELKNRLDGILDRATLAESAAIDEGVFLADDVLSDQDVVAMRDAIEKQYPNAVDAVRERKLRDALTKAIHERLDGEGRGETRSADEATEPGEPGEGEHGDGQHDRPHGRQEAGDDAAVDRTDGPAAARSEDAVGRGEPSAGREDAAHADDADGLTSYTAAEVTAKLEAQAAELKKKAADEKAAAAKEAADQARGSFSLTGSDSARDANPAQGELGDVKPGMTRAEAISFAEMSASGAHDQRDAYDDSFSSHRENVIDTLTDEHVTDPDYHDALDAFDAAYKKQADSQAAPAMAHHDMSYQAAHKEAVRLTQDTGEKHVASKVEWVGSDGETNSTWRAERESAAAAPKGMTLEEAKAHVAQANIDRPIGGSWDRINQMQGGKLDTKGLSPIAAASPVAETTPEHSPEDVKALRNRVLAAERGGDISAEFKETLLDELDREGGYEFVQDQIDGDETQYSRAFDPKRRALLGGMASAAALASMPVQANGVVIGKAKPVSEALLMARVTPEIEAVLRGPGKDDAAARLIPVGHRPLKANDDAGALKRALTMIAQTGPKELRALAAKIANLIPDTGIDVRVDDKTLANAHGVVEYTGRPTLTLYTAEDRHGLSYATVLHESLHAAVLARYKSISNGAVRGNDALFKLKAPEAAAALEQFKQVWREFQAKVQSQPGTNDKDLALSIDQANGNPDEFFVRALTDPKLQAWLASQEYEGKTLWARFKDWIKTNLLGFRSGGTAPSWLDAALAASNDLVEGMGTDQADFKRMVASKDLSRASNRDAMYSRITTTEGEKWVADADEATRSFVEKAGMLEKPRSFKGMVKSVTDNANLKLRQAIADQFAALKELDPQAYILARMSKSTEGTVEALMFHGQILMDKDGGLDVKGGRGVLDILKDLKGEHNRFMSWLVGQRAQQLMREGREHNFTQAEVDAATKLNGGTLANGTPRSMLYNRVNEELRKSNESVLDIALRAGLIDPEAHGRFVKDKYYVPFFRVKEDGSIEFKTAGSGLVNQKQFRTLKGGAEILNDPLQNMIQNWSTIISASAKNVAAQRAIEVAKSVGIAEQVEAKDKGTVAIRVAGKDEHYLISDPMVMQAVSALSYTGFNSNVMKVLGSFRKWLTMGATISPTFKINNLIRDSVSAIGSSGLSYNAAANIAKGWTLTAHDNPVRARMMAGGAMFRFGVITDGDNAHLVRRLIKAGVDSDTILSTPEKAANLFKNLFNKYHELGDRSENANRAALYQQRRDEGATHLQASFEARDLMDFSLTGASTAVRFLNQTIPFLNARIQGLYKLGRAANEDPRKFSIVAGAVGLASVALYTMFKDDDDFKRREDWDRDNFWWAKIGGVQVRVPKPFELGAMATILERGLEQMVDDKAKAKDFLSTLKSMTMNTFAFNPMPQMFKPMVDVYGNKDSFTDRPIESLGMERRLKQDRFDNNTTMIARGLGKVTDSIGLSPKQLDFMAQAYFGWVGANAMRLGDSVLRPAFDEPGKAAMTSGQTPVVGTFIRDSAGAQSKYVTRFYDGLNQATQVYASVSNYKALGQLDKAKELAEDNKDILATRRLYMAGQKQATFLTTEIHKVEQSRDPMFTADEKRRLIDAITERRNVLMENIDNQVRSRK